MSSHAHSSVRPAPDQVLVDIADYVTRADRYSDLARDTARHCLIDTLGCGLLALNFPACVKMMGPIVPGAELEKGARIPGTAFRLDPVTAAFNIGCMVRWLDFNDTWLAAEWGHPSDNLGAILAVSDWLCRARGQTLTMGDVLTAMIQAHEIQGVLALKNSFNRVGLDHVLLVKIASTAVAARLLGATHAQIVDALSQAFVDGQSLRTYRHAPNTGSRKSWAAGDATARAVRLALATLAGEVGYPSAVTAKQWGFQDVLFKGQPIVRERPYASYVMENVLFKIAFPAEFHAQTAVEAAITLRPRILGRMGKIKRIRIWTHESAMRIISKVGPLNNPADRDHCLQYMIAIGLIVGDLEAGHYEDAFHAANPDIDRLRDLMTVEEEPAFSRDYLDPELRSIANAMQIEFTDGTSTDRVDVPFPLGHRRRRSEGVPLLERKFANNLRTRFGDAQVGKILAATANRAALEAMPVPAFTDLFAVG